MPAWWSPAAGKLPPWLHSLCTRRCRHCRSAADLELLKHTGLCKPSLHALNICSIAMTVSHFARHMLKAGVAAVVLDQLSI